MINLFKKPPPVLTSARLVLRAPEISDFADWADLRRASRDFLAPFEPVLPDDAFTKQGYAARLRAQKKQAAEGYCRPFYIRRASDNVLLGAINLNRITRGFGQMATLGYWIGAPHARQGYMSEALQRIVRHAFDDMKLHRLDAGCLPHNTASRRLLEKNGFVEEGVARKLVRIAGIWQDHVVYARLCDD